MKRCDAHATLFEQRQAGAATVKSRGLIDGTRSEIERREALNKRRVRGLDGESAVARRKTGRGAAGRTNPRRSEATVRRKRAREVGASGDASSAERRRRFPADAREETRWEASRAWKRERAGPHVKAEAARVKYLAQPETLEAIAATRYFEASQSGANRQLARETIGDR